MLDASSCLLVYENASASVAKNNCLDLLHCAFLRKSSACVRNITVFCQLLLRSIKSAVWPIPIYWYNPKIAQYISQADIGLSVICSAHSI